MPIVGPDPSPPPATDCGPWLQVADLTCQALVEQAEERRVGLSAEVVAVASDLIWGLSARRFGPSCPIPLRPCSRTWCNQHRGMAASSAWNVWPCDLPGAVLDLVRFAPVYDVVEVLIDGAVFTEWRLDDDRLLRRTDGFPWPLSQSIALGADQPDTFQPTIRMGEAIPQAGLRAVDVYSCELLKARLNDGTCRLPANTRNVARQGVTVELGDPADYLVDGKTGIPEVDAFLLTYNPHGLAQRSSVISVDRPKATVLRA